MIKKCSTDQSFIRKRNTTYRIHTLEKKNSLPTKNKVVDGKTPGQVGNLKQLFGVS